MVNQQWSEIKTTISTHRKENIESHHLVCTGCIFQIHNDRKEVVRGIFKWQLVLLMKNWCRFSIRARQQQNSINPHLRTAAAALAFYQPRSGRSCDGVGQKKKKKKSYLWVFGHCSHCIWWFPIFSNDFYQITLIPIDFINYLLFPLIFH